MSINNPHFRRWHQDNTWYLRDEQMTRYADAYAAEHPVDRPYMNWLDTVGEATRQAFPHKVENPNRSKPSSVDGGAVRGTVSPGPRGRGYDSLPSEAREACQRFVDRGLMTKEEYTRNYYEQED